MRLAQIVRGTMLALVVMVGTSGAAEIKIGAAEALTGNASQYGVPIRKGFELRSVRSTAQGASTERRWHL